MDMGEAVIVAPPTPVIREWALPGSNTADDIVRRKKSLNIHSPITSGYNTASILPECSRVKDNVKTKNLSAKGSRKEPRGVDMLCLRAR